MTVLVVTHPTCLEHPTGGGLESAARIHAVLEGVRDVGLGEAVTIVPSRAASIEDLARVHSMEYLDALRLFCVDGGGQLDELTAASSSSWDAALVAAGAGMEAADRLTRGEGSAAFCAVRPPGHHARTSEPIGFCLLNNVAVTARWLGERGERVLILDWDAHHGNGTQETFYRDPRVAYVSFHQFPLFPGTGDIRQMGTERGLGTTINFPFPAGTTGDTYRSAMEEVVLPFSEDFRPTWILVSAGFDAHRADPAAGLRLSAGDFADLTAAILDVAATGRLVLFLEGGYDLQALKLSTAACVARLTGAEYRPEPPTSGGPGDEVVGNVRRMRQALWTQ